jgi:pimeloyl-ACP methyl ester carboxylesterase
VVAGAFLLCWIVGACYQTFARSADRDAYPPPGVLVDVGGTRLHLDCRGEGLPVVILEAGLTAASTSWVLVHEAMAAQTRVCAYDRPGLDWSEPIEGTAGPAAIAQRLRGLLDAAGIAGPYVLVGMSAGGVYVREYFAQFPEGVVGMVLVDSSHEAQADRLEPIDNPGPIDQETLLAICHVLQPFGWVRASGYLDSVIEERLPRDMPQEAASAMKANMNRSHGCRAIGLEIESFHSALADPREPRSLGDLPLLVLSQGKPPVASDELGLSLENARARRAVWDGLQMELAALSSRGERRVAADSGHVIQMDQPALVIEAVGDMVRGVR